MNRNGPISRILKLSIYTAVAILSLSSAFIHAQTNPSPFTTGKRYNLNGELTGTISAAPGSYPPAYPAIRNTYNAQGLLVTVESGVLQSWQSEAVKPENWADFTIISRAAYTYDTWGRKLSETHSDRNSNIINITQFSYDNLKRLECTVTRMNSSAFGTLPVSACELGAAGSHGNDRVTKYTYDNRDRGISVQKAFGTTLSQFYARHTYNDYWMPSSVTDANGNRTELRYDGFGRLKRRVFPSKLNGALVNESDYVEYSYDLNGNVRTERKRNGAVITYTYDKNDRLVKKDYSNNALTQDIYYNYDLRGLQLSARFGSQSGQGITNVYDGFGNLANSTTNMGGVSRTLVYQYDNNGNRTRITHPDNVYFGYAFDGINRLSAITEKTFSLINVTYNPGSQRETLTRAGSATTTYTFDDVARLESLQQDFNGTTNDLTSSFSYNPARQVTSLTLSNDLFHYQGNQNRLGSYTPNGLNQYTHIAGQPLSYDTNGNLTNDGSLIYTYDDENRLVSTSGGATSSFKYDPLGRLHEVIINGTTTRFLYDGDALVTEYNSAGTLTRRYVHGDRVDEPLVQYNNAYLNYERRYLHADHQGSIIAHSNYMGSVSNRLTYDAYGIPDSANIDRFGYTGQLWFKELGLFHYKARMYSPKLGRFLQTDPVGYADQMNLYAYVGNDPINFVDPTGMTNCPNWDTSCVETPESANKVGPPEPKTDEEMKIEEVVVTGHRVKKPKVRYGNGNEYFFVADTNSIRPQKFKTKEIKCGRTRMTLGIGQISQGQSAVHSHSDSHQSVPSHGDGAAAKKGGTGIAFMMTSSRVFSIESMSDGTYRTTVASGPGLSADERAALVTNMQNWENSGSTKGTKSDPCP